MWEEFNDIRFEIKLAVCEDGSEKRPDDKVRDEFESLYFSVIGDTDMQAICNKFNKNVNANNDSVASRDSSASGSSNHPNNTAKEIFEHPNLMKESYSDLRNLYDSVSKNSRCLKSLGENTDSWDSLIIYIISNEFDATTRRDWKSEKYRGASVFWAIMKVNQIRLGSNLPVLQDTEFGYVIAGNLKCNSVINNATSLGYHASVEAIASIDHKVAKFWDWEEVNNKQAIMSEAEKYCERYFEKTTERNSTGRFVVRIPFKTSIKQLGIKNLLELELWWKGPCWFNRNNSEWNALKINVELTEIPEHKGTSCLSGQFCDFLSNLLSTYLSFKTILHVLAYVLRFISNQKLKGELSNKRELNALQPREVDKALNVLIKEAQKQCYSTEYNALVNKKSVPKGSKILCLNPFLQNDILRVGGRIKHSNQVFDKMHPIILQKILLFAMAAKYKIISSHLELDELSYELEIRGFPISCDINLMRKELTKILKLEKIGHGCKYPEFSKAFADEFKACNDKVIVLTKKINDFTTGSDRKEFLILNSRLSHLMARADRLAMANEQEKTQRAEIISKVLKISEQLNETLKTRKPQGHNETVSFLQSSSDSEGDIENRHASTPTRPIDGARANFSDNRLSISIKPVPVYKWGLKFSGDSKGLSIGAFLERVDELQIARGVSEDELFLSALDLFSGRALNWFRGAFADEFKACNDKVIVLTKKINDFTTGSDRKEFLILNSRLSHLMARADRLAMANEQEKTQRAEIISKVLKISEQLNETLKTRKPQGHNETVSFLQSSSDSEGDIENRHASTPTRPIDGARANFSDNRLSISIKPVPVYKWGLKFSGDSKGLSIGAFLERVDELQIARGVSEDELFLSALDLFSGRALNWFRGAFADEFKACNDKVIVLTKKINDFTTGSDRKEFLILNSRLSHLMARADRLAMANEQEKTQRAEIISKVLKISEQLNETLKTRKPQGHNETVSFLQSSSDSEGDIENRHASTPTRPIDGARANFSDNRLSISIKPVPVYKWGLKFSGDSKGLSIGAFLERVDELQIARGVSEDELFLSALDLFSGRALNWFRGVRTTLRNWLSSSPTEEEKLKIIMWNIHPSIQDKLALVEINSEEELLKYGRKIEEVEARKKAISETRSSRPQMRLEPDLAYVEGIAKQKHEGNMVGGEVYSNSISAANLSEFRCWNCNLIGHSARGCKAPHSGASRTVLGGRGYDMIRKLNCFTLVKSSHKCTVANGEQCESIGTISMPIQLNDKTEYINVLVVPSLPHLLILGLDFWKIMGIVPNLRDRVWHFANSEPVHISSISAYKDLTLDQSTRLNSLIDSKYSHEVDAKSTDDVTDKWYKKMIKKINDNPLKYPQWSKHEVTGYTPYYLNFGREIVLSGNMHGLSLAESGIEFEQRAATETKFEKLKDIFDFVRQRLNKAYYRSKANYDLRRRNVKFSIGQKVWRKNFVLSNASKDFAAKLSKRFIGPFIIKEAMGNNTYHLSDQLGNDKGCWHVKDLKSHPPEDIAD
ncbi:hypothetical protein FQR65_LT14562 [Abscondita terminalis]|nr:hypothetical protein FQR65_LT14562 [Abscondita terminalis]